MTDSRHVSADIMAAALNATKQTTDDDDTLPDRYTERAAETLAYRLMEYLEFLGVIGKDHVSYLRWPPIDLIEDAEAALRDDDTPDALVDVWGELFVKKYNLDQFRAALDARGLEIRTKANAHSKTV